MPKLTGPCFSLSASKSLKKTLTFQKRPSGSSTYAYKKPGSRAPFTVSTQQTIQRDHFRHLVDDWNKLTRAQKDEWNEASEGVGYAGTGFNYFIHKGGAGLLPSVGPISDARLLETGDYLLLETGDYRLLE